MYGCKHTMQRLFLLYQSMGNSMPAFFIYINILLTGIFNGIA
jgi:hypothetical protein